MSERIERYDQLFNSSGWAQYQEDVAKAVSLCVTMVMDQTNTSKPGWQEKAAKYINRYQALREVVINAERNIKAEKQNERGANQGDSQ